MKNSSTGKNFQTNPVKTDEGVFENRNDKPISSKAAKKIMTEQLIAPPARVWDKIERILDQQDERRKQGTEILSTTFRNKPSMGRKKNVFIAAAAGVTLVAGLLIIVF